MLYGYALCIYVYHRVQTRLSVLLELELQEIMNHSVWVLKLNLGPLQGQQVFNH